MGFVDNFLNRITMYRLVLYYLTVVWVVALIESIFGLFPFKTFDFFFSTLLILMVCWASNALFSKIFNAPTNVESVYITAFILALIISPIAPTSWNGIGFLVFASLWAMASKYILAIRKKHIFNPAAIGVAAAALLTSQSATWWVGGNLQLLPFVLIGGLLIVRKIRRFDLVVAFSIVSLATIVLTAHGSTPATAIQQTLQHTSFFFLALVMLTEPLTMPPTRTLRIVYGALVGFLFAPNVHIGSLYFTPELALVVGNVFVYFVSPKGRYMLTLLEKKTIASDTLEFTFTPDHRVLFAPGQYLEWTLPHAKPDDRGNRRFFTISSSPTESVVRLGVRIYEPKSSFKTALVNMKEGEKISAGTLGGEFVLPADRNKKLVFIAGGIGITPFRSMVRSMMDTGEARTITLLYSNKKVSEIAYRELFDAAGATINLKTVYAITDESSSDPRLHDGRIDGALIAREVPDYKERLFYLSGSHGMVTAFENTLQAMGVSRFNIKTDYFPGFV